MKRPNTLARKSGFTLIELLVVLAIVAIISSITFGAFKSINEGNRRTTCQSNMAQIYQSCRQYAQDFDGRFPYLNGGAVTNAVANHDDTPQGGIGLWSLYTFPNANGFNNCSTTSVNLSPVGEPSRLTGYVKSNRVFHCPSDDFKTDIEYYAGSACSTQSVDSGVFSFVNGNTTYVNPAYLSYQVKDDVSSDDTYLSVRKADNNPKAVRQLLPFTINTTLGKTETPERPTRDFTVVTWCRFHRKLDSNGLTKTGGRNYDNVLFSDGSVENLPMEQTVTENPSGITGTCTAWNRVPRAKAEDMLDAANCIPKP